MEKISYQWELYQEQETTETRYCHNCGRKVTFSDTGQKRSNANGKDIYEFAIYKCRNGHTWNKSLGACKSKENKRSILDSTIISESKTNRIRVMGCRNDGIKEIEIIIMEVNGVWRLDKLLARQIEDLSRNHIDHLIVFGKILVNDRTVEAKMRIKKGDRISIFL